MRPDFLVIGHICKDLVAGGGAIGGTAAYATLAAQHLGRKVGVVTSLPADFDLKLFLPRIELAVIPSPVATTFHNIYRGGEREQYLLEAAAPLPPAAVPPEWREAEVVLLGPVAREIGEEMVSLFSGSLVGLSAQGLLRAWDEEGRVSFSPPPGVERSFSAVDVLFFSEEDVGGDGELARRYAQLAPLAVVTRGAQGGTLYRGTKIWDYPGYESQVLDPTGAGDVFAAAFLVRLSETRDPREAARFASCAAALAIEEPGLLGIPTRAQVEARLL